MNPFVRVKNGVTITTPLKIYPGVAVSTGRWVVTFHPYKTPVCQYSHGGCGEIWIHFICFGNATVEFLFYSFNDIFKGDGLVFIRCVNSIEDIPVPTPGSQRFYDIKRNEKTN